MSRSFRKSTFTSYTCAKSEKWWKRNWHGKMRCKERDKLKEISLYDPISDSVVEVYVDEDQQVCEIPIMEVVLYGGQDYQTTEVLEVSNPYDSPKDGRYHFSLNKMREFYLTWPGNKGCIERLMHKLVAK